MSVQITEKDLETDFFIVDSIDLTYYKGTLKAIIIKKDKTEYIFDTGWRCKAEITNTALIHRSKVTLVLFLRERMEQLINKVKSECEREIKDLEKDRDNRIVSLKQRMVELEA